LCFETEIFLGVLYKKKKKNGFGQKVFFTTKYVFSAYYTKSKVFFWWKIILFSFPFDVKSFFMSTGLKNNMPLPPKKKGGVFHFPALQSYVS
jgi:hypothetical protein